ncbi:MAG: ATP-binding cassette domain-containing protein [Pseudomonadota bacterium]
MSPILTVEKLKLSVAGRVLFADLSFELPERGLTALMGPVATGKSSLLSWICCEDSPYAAKVEQVSFNGSSLGEEVRPVLIPQHAAQSGSSIIEQIDQVLGNTPLLCVDEPTAGLTDQDAEQVMSHLVQISRDRAVLMVSHNQRQVASFADTVLLLAGGCVQEHVPASTFFAAPQSKAGQQFVGTGGTTVPRPDTPAHHLSPEQRGVPTALNLQPNADRDGNTPLWVMNDKLGIFWPRDKHPDSTEIASLADSGVTAVISVSQANPPNLPALIEAGIVPVWIPLTEQDRSASKDTAPVCLECQRLLDNGEKVVVLATDNNQMAECTLASQLIYSGLTAEKAVKYANQILDEQDLSMENEQLLWDLEMHWDLVAEGLAETPGRRGRRTGKGVALGSIDSMSRSMESQH